ncbi:MAG TPA: hypothetical protein VGT60_07985 [Candidatus Limnocylindria bacterium]|nr:hypothetical protein [Candidatus Limnocylindria bacterium]
MTPQFGWALTTDRLAVTRDAGTTWATATPPGITAAQLATVFFLDASHGWAVAPGARTLTTPVGTELQLFRTSDGGTTWTRTTAGRTLWGSPGSMLFTFFDQQHGWLEIALEGSPLAAPSQLLATDDGGATWRAMPMIGRGAIRFSSTKVGWLASNGYARGGRLLRTVDGGVSWTDVSPAIPTSHSGTRALFTTPRMFDLNTGALFVSYSQDHSPSTAPGFSFFVTRDGGATWSIAIDEVSSAPFVADAPHAFAIADANHWAVIIDGQLKTTADGGRSTRRATAVGLSATVAGVDFVSGSLGWALSITGTTAIGQLLRTTDGGATWTPVAP